MLSQNLSPVVLDMALGKVSFPKHEAGNVLVVMRRDIFVEERATEESSLLDVSWQPLSWSITLEVLYSCIPMLRLVPHLATMLPRSVWQRSDEIKKKELMQAQDVINGIQIGSHGLLNLARDAGKIFFNEDESVSWLDCFNREQIEKNLSRLGCLSQEPHRLLPWALHSNIVPLHLSASTINELVDKISQAIQQTKIDSVDVISASTKRFVMETVKEAYLHISKAMNHVVVQLSMARQDKMLLMDHQKRLESEATLVLDYQRMLNAPRLAESIRVELNRLKRILRETSSLRLSDADIHLLPNVFGFELLRARQAASIAIYYGMHASATSMELFNPSKPSSSSTSPATVSQFLQNHLTAAETRRPLVKWEHSLEDTRSQYEQEKAQCEKEKAKYEQEKAQWEQEKAKYEQDRQQWAKEREELYIANGQLNSDCESFKEDILRLNGQAKQLKESRQKLCDDVIQLELQIGYEGSCNTTDDTTTLIELEGKLDASEKLVREWKEQVGEKSRTAATMALSSSLHTQNSGQFNANEVTLEEEEQQDDPIGPNMDPDMDPKEVEMLSMDKAAILRLARHFYTELRCANTENALLSRQVSILHQRKS